MKKNVMRLVSWLLVVAMVAAMPVTAFAEDRHEHTFTTQVKSAVTCTGQGHTTLTCSGCGYKTRVDYTPARHNYGARVRHISDDPDKEDYFVHTCKDCGFEMIEAAHEHAYTKVIAAPTCVRAGYTEFHCTACDYQYTIYDTDPATGHDWGEFVVTKEATTEKMGEEVATCKTCGETDVRPIERLAPTAKTATIVNTEVAKVYKEADTSSEVVGVVLKGSRFNGEARDTAKKWCSIGEDRWVKMDYVKVNSNEMITSQYAGAQYWGVAKNTVQLKVRTGPSNLSTVLSTLSSGAEIAIYAITKDSDNVAWGRISKTEEKWVDLSYVTYYKVLKGTLPDGNSDTYTPPASSTESSSTSSSAAATVIATGTVNSSMNLNVRSDAKISALNLIGSLPSGSKVEIYKTKDVDGHTWGKIKYNGGTGWICLDYVVLTSGSTGSSSTSSSSSSSSAAVSTPNATVVNCSVGVNVRKSSSVTSDLISVIPVNTRVVIDKLKTGWGHVEGKGWVYLDYIKLDAGAEEAIKAGSSSTSTGSSTTTTENPLPSYTNITAPAIVSNTAGAPVYSAATNDASSSKKLMTLAYDANEETLYEISNRTRNTKGEWGKVTVGNITGWVNLADMSMIKVTGTVSADTANVYKAMNPDGQVVTVLGKGSKVTIEANGQENDGTYIWGKLDGTNTYIQMHKLTLSYRTDSASTSNTVKSVSVTGKTNANSVPLKKAASDTSDTLLTLEKGAAVTVTDWTSAGGTNWGKVKIGQFTGWIAMDNIEQDAVKGTVTADSMNLYNSYASSTIELVMRKGDKVTVSERILYGTSIWGRMTVNKKEYWGNMANVTLDSEVVEPAPTTPSASTTPTTPATPAVPETPAASASAAGTIVNADKVNVRSGAGVGNAKVTELARGTKVTVYEQKTVDDALWGRIDQGWVAMQYVDLSTKTTSTGSTAVSGGTILTSVPSGAVAVGFVNTADLAVRSAPNGTKTGTLAKGTNVTILEQQLKDGMIWGRIDKGWICTSYVTLTGTSVTGSGSAGTIKGCFYTANIRSAPGVGNAVVGKVMVNSRVEIYEQQMYSGEAWGRTSIGWIAMQYVLIGSVPTV